MSIAKRSSRPVRDLMTGQNTTAFLKPAQHDRPISLSQRLWRSFHGDANGHNDIKPCSYHKAAGLDGMQHWSGCAAFDMDPPGRVEGLINV